MNISNFFISSLSFMGPLLFATLACLMMQKAGILNLGVDGTMIIGGLFYGIFIKSYLGTGDYVRFLGFLIAIFVGVILGIIHSFLTITLKANQFLVSLIWNYLALAISNIILILNFNQRSLDLKDISIQPIYLIYPLTLLFIFNLILIFSVIIFLNLTKNGLYLKAAGKSDVVLTLSHINIILLRYIVVTVSFVLTTLAGALFVSQKGSFNGTVDGIGIIAFIIVALSQWAVIRSIVFSYLMTVLLQLSSFYEQDASKWWWALIPYITPLLIAPFFNTFSINDRIPKMLNTPYMKENN